MYLIGQGQAERSAIISWHGPNNTFVIINYFGTQLPGSESEHESDVCQLEGEGRFEGGCPIMGGLKNFLLYICLALASVLGTLHRRCLAAELTTTLQGRAI